MRQELVDYLRELKAYGFKHNIPNISEKGGQFLNMLIRLKKPKSILEIGCANGYSTIWMAEAAKAVGAVVKTIDHSTPTFNEAKQNLKQANLAAYVDFHFGDAINVISQMKPEISFDFVFVDGEKSSYLDFWKAIEPRLDSGAVAIFDDMLAFPKKTELFSAHIKSVVGIEQLTIPLDGNDGILLITKH
jgi:predicted O-methyltransferase YrrM